eukprot:Filipodium_phascolosomae@DN2636_c0_g1_i1.p1
MVVAKVFCYTSRQYDQVFFDEIKKQLKADDVEFKFCEEFLTKDTVHLAKGYPVVGVWVNDDLCEANMKALHAGGMQAIAVRCAGFNKVDIDCAEKLGVTVVRVPAYSPETVAEHAWALMTTLNRKVHKAYNRVRDGNFYLGGLSGRCLHGKTVGILGTGRIGVCSINIARGYGMNVIAHDIYESDVVKGMGIKYYPLEEFAKQCDFVTVHIPLDANNKYLIGENFFKNLKKGCLLVNTSRGPLLDTRAAIKALKDGTLRGLAIDVYENEDGLFFCDRSSEVIKDDLFRELISMSNVLMTAHMAYLTELAVQQIATTTITNVQSLIAGKASGNEVTKGAVKALKM